MHLPVLKTPGILRGDLAQKTQIVPLVEKRHVPSGWHTLLRVSRRISVSFWRGLWASVISFASKKEKSRELSEASGPFPWALGRPGRPYKVPGLEAAAGWGPEAAPPILGGMAELGRGLGDLTQVCVDGLPGFSTEGKPRKTHPSEAPSWFRQACLEDGDIECCLPPGRELGTTLGF